MQVERPKTLCPIQQRVVVILPENTSMIAAQSSILLPADVPRGPNPLGIYFIVALQSQVENTLVDRQPR